jgi:transposase
MKGKVEIGMLALDIGAKKHATAVAFGTKRKDGEVENTPAALRKYLVECAAKCVTLRVIMEATGIYFLDVALLATELGAEVMVINPKAAHHFAKALSSRSKTDAIDARVLLAYLERMPFQPWQRPAENLLALRQFGRHLSQLKAENTAVKNRLHALDSTATSPKLLRDDLKRASKSLDRRIEQISAAALKLVRADADLSARLDALDSIVGVAETSALTLLGEMLVMPQDMTSRSCVCHAGLDVRLHQSGTSVARPARLSKHGNKYLRHALYMPALTAITHDPHARAFYERLLARGKKKLQAIAAVMRKMLTAAWVLVRCPAEYDGAKLYAKMT